MPSCSHILSGGFMLFKSLFVSKEFVMLRTTPKRLTACLLTALLVLSFAFVAAAQFGPLTSHASAHSTVVATDVEDNDLPGSYVNNKIQLHPSSHAHGSIPLTITGDGLTPGDHLVLGTDMSIRCSSDGGISGTTETVDSFGDISDGTFTIFCARASTYLVVAIDITNNKVYNAILPLT